MSAAAAPAFDAWLDDVLAAYYRRNPVSATFIGVHDYDDRLPDWSEAGLAEAEAELAGLRQRLDQLPDEPLSTAQRLDRTVAAGHLEIQRWELSSRHFQRGNPSLFIGEVAFGFISLFLRPYAPLAERVEAAIARLEDVPRFLSDARAVIGAAPGAWIERAIRECGGALALLSDGVNLLLAAEGMAEPRLSDTLRGTLREAAEHAASAVADFYRLLTRLAEHATDAYAAGPEALDLLIRHGHFLERDAAEIERYAQEVLASTQARLEEGAAALGFAGWPAALAGLGDRHPSAAEYQARFEMIWLAAKEYAVARGLVTWPDYPIRYVPRPAWTRAAAPMLYFLFYRAPAAFDRVPVVDYLIAPLPEDPAAQEPFLRANNDAVITLNHVIHHGGLGHHVQNWYAYNRAESRLGRIAAVDCAARIALFSGGTMAEGWACYATELMDEAGFLSPLEHLSELHSRLRMAARAVVDVRLHSGVMRLDEAAAFYRDRTGMAPDAAHAEAVKNSMFPGAALMYLMGTDLIWSLRRELAARPGFELRAFHDRLLAHGSLPVALIAAEMRGDAAGLREERPD